MASLEGLTLGDMTQTENVKDCRHELDRVTDDAGFAAWARKWGGALVSHCEARAPGHSRHQYIPPVKAAPVAPRRR